MGNQVLEQDDPVGGNDPVLEQPETPADPQVAGEDEGQPEVPETKAPAVPAQPEPTVEIDGQQVPLSRAKEALDRYSNDEKWTAKNTQRAQELAKQEREIAEARFIAERVKGRPDIIQRLLQPEPERNFDQEIQAHYEKRAHLPVNADGQVDMNAYTQWERERDGLVREGAKRDAAREAEQNFIQRSAKESNEQLSGVAFKSWQKEGFTESDFIEASTWIVGNIKQTDGKFPSNAYDLARHVLFADRETRKGKLDAATKTAESIERAKPAKALGVKVGTESESDLSDEEKEFLAEAEARRHK